MRRSPSVVLFDLDGTLVDSAPDLAQAANRLRGEHGLAALPDAHYRPWVGSGGRGMVKVAFGVHPGEPGFDALKQRFLLLYAQCLLDKTQVFDGIWPALLAVAKLNLRWGIVTNKAMAMAEPIVRGLGLQSGAMVLIAGDSTAHTKPHPAPLLAAAERLGIDPLHCVYVGDDIRDMQAARAAGMPGLAAAWGYLGQGASIDSWGATEVLQQPEDLLHWLHLA